MPSYLRAKILRSLLLLLAILILLPHVAAAANLQSSTLSLETASSIDAAVHTFQTKTHVPGIAVAIVTNGKVSYTKGYGEADVAHHREVTPQTLFRLASVSKSLTATGAMQLAQSSKLDLDAPIQKYCPQFPEKPYPITTRELLGHLGGIRHYKFVDNDPELINTTHFSDPIAAGIRFFANDPLVEIPGAKFHYSTQGYTLVGCAIEGASGDTYVNYMLKSVMAPAGMTHTVADDATANIPERTAFYSGEKKGEITDAMPLDDSYKIPGGGWLSSADDMAAFIVAMLDDKLVSRATRDLMWTPQKTTTGSPDTYGYGFDIEEAHGTKFVAHTGGQQGTSTNIMIAPATNTGVVVLINANNEDATALARDIMHVVFSAPSAQAKSTASN